MAIRISPLAIGSRHGLPSSLAVLFPISPGRNNQVLSERSSSRIKDKAGDDEHGRHRQHLRKRFRGRLFGGFLHAVLPRSGHDSSLRGSANDVRNFTRNTPRRVFAGLSPHSREYRPSQGRTAMRRHFGSHAAGLCAADGILKAISGRDAWIARRRGGRCSGVAGWIVFRIEPAIQ